MNFGSSFVHVPNAADDGMLPVQCLEIAALKKETVR